MSNRGCIKTGMFLRRAGLVLCACAALCAFAVADARRDQANPKSELGGQTGADRAIDTPAANVAIEASERAWIAQANRRLIHGFGAATPQVVDYRDDEPSRLRRAGLLTGPLPLVEVSGGVATDHLPCPVANPDCCTFDIDCEDSDPCTTDRCAISPQGPLGAGSCVHQQVAVGLSGECDDGIFCNGLEFCNSSGQCSVGLTPTCCAGDANNPSEMCSEDLARCSADSSVAGRRCMVDGECPGGRCDHCVAFCDTNADCDDGVTCNGIEQCVAGVCEPGDPPCGLGANCFEKRCIGSLITTACINDADCGTNETCGSKVCSGFGGGACVADSDCGAGQSCVPAFVCRLGRCCPPGASTDDCIARSLESCLATGGQWYAGEGGEDTGNLGECGGNRSVIGAQQLGCPVYSSGIVQTSAAVPQSPLLVGPVSLSPKSILAPAGPGTPLQRLGDDYQLAGTSPVALEAVRIVGGMLVPDAVFVEIWDENGLFIEDFLFRPSRQVAVNLLELSPPLTIPARGRISVRNKVEFAADAKFVWASATASQTGGNNADLLFVNDDPSFSIASSAMMGGAPAILAFELAGRATSAPLGGCCHGNAAICTNELSWVCEAPGSCSSGTCVGGINSGEPCADDNDCRGTFLGFGTLCATCRSGDNASAPCETCQGGTEPGDFSCTGDLQCQARGLGGVCLPNDTICNSGSATCSNNSGTICMIDGDCSARPGICSNIDQNCAVSSDCPTGGICGGAGKCESGVCAVVESCGVGACCLADGSCQEGTTEATCSGTFQGGATTCDPNCCPAPFATGRDNCADVVIGALNTIPALDPADPPTVLTFTGDNSVATSTAQNPDSCFGEARDLDDDRGWWEGFALADTCTRVRIDLCCSIPVQFANWPWLAKDCNCNGIVNAKLDPNLPNLSEAARGAPFCNEDNLWVNLGLLPAGNYYYSIRSALSGTLGPYTMHVVAQACPEAACCLVSGGCITVNQLECDAVRGFFLAPPNKFPATTACVANPPTCGVGACCTAPGECVDQDLGNAITESDCNFFGGSFIGGMKCSGGVCAQDDRFSCSTGQDCLDQGAGCPIVGSCCVAPGGDERTLAQSTPCPICELQGSGQCQSESISADLAAISELSLGTGIVHADDFIPGADLDVLDQVCVWGVYASSDPNQPGLDCGNSIASDRFRVRVYRDNGFNLPGELVGESSASSVRGVLDPGIFPPSIQQWVFQLTLDTPISGLTPGDLHWIEVANDLPSEAQCFWSWSLLSSASTQGNDHMAGTSVTVGYVPGSERLSDAAWCMPGSFSVPPAPVRASCACAGSCFAESFDDAQRNSHSFQIDAINTANVPLDCSEFVCPSDGTPFNDDFGNAQEVGVGFFSYETYCATTDGLAVEPSELGNAAVTLDVWYKFTAVQDCELVVSQCASGTADTAGFDAILGVYTDGTGVCPDPRTQPVADVTRVSQNGPLLSDEDCCGQDFCGGPGLIRVPASKGQCFTIRAAAFNGQGNERGRGVIDITCGGPICGDGLVNAPGEVCDGADLGLCADSCIPPGNPNECTCGTVVCGNGIVEGSEVCDGNDDAACPGSCTPQCVCVAECGNGFASPGEECDGNDDKLCPGRCQADCTCPPKFCGNNFTDLGEECDGTDNGLCSDGACRPPGDPAGGCTCACEACPAPVDPALSPSFVPRDRFISFMIPNVINAGPFTLEVQLTSLHHPADPVPMGSPDFSALEGQIRYVRLIRDPNGDPVTDCLDSAAFQTTYKCATLGCDPEPVDWVTLFGGHELYVTGDAIVPDSVYRVRRSPFNNQLTCAPVFLDITTARWGDIQGDTLVNISDVVSVVDRVKDAFGAISESAALLHPAIPAPQLSSPNVLDVTLAVDALKLLAYPFTISTCP